MSLIIEGVVDGRMNPEKTLCGSRRLEPLHFALSSPHYLMGVFGAIILSKTALMTTDEVQVPESRVIGTQLVGDQHFGAKLYFLSSLRINRRAAWISRRRSTSMSRISPS